MENKTEDEIRKRWEQEAKDKAEKDEEAEQRPKKRVRAIEYQMAQHSLNDDELEELFGTRSENNRAAGGRGAASKKTTRPRPTRGKKKVTEIVEEEDDVVVELD
jgi:antitoxin component HigA of HigAB toxin-antitoxin module